MDEHLHHQVENQLQFNLNTNTDPKNLAFTKCLQPKPVIVEKLDFKAENDLTTSLREAWAAGQLQSVSANELSQLVSIARRDVLDAKWEEDKENAAAASKKGGKTIKQMATGKSQRITQSAKVAGVKKPLAKKVVTTRATKLVPVAKNNQNNNKGGSTKSANRANRPETDSGLKKFNHDDRQNSHEDRVKFEIVRLREEVDKGLAQVREVEDKIKNGTPADEEPSPQKRKSLAKADEQNHRIVRHIYGLVQQVKSVEHELTEMESMTDKEDRKNRKRELSTRLSAIFHSSVSTLQTIVYHLQDFQLELGMPRCYRDVAALLRRIANCLCRVDMKQESDVIDAIIHDIYKIQEVVYKEIAIGQQIPSKDNSVTFSDEATSIQSKSIQMSTRKTSISPRRGASRRSTGTATGTAAGQKASRSSHGSSSKRMVNSPLGMLRKSSMASSGSSSAKPKGSPPRTDSQRTRSLSTKRTTTSMSSSTSRKLSAAPSSPKGSGSIKPTTRSPTSASPTAQPKKSARRVSAVAKDSSSQNQQRRPSAVQRKTSPENRKPSNINSTGSRRLSTSSSSRKKIRKSSLKSAKAKPESGPQVGKAEQMYNKYADIASAMLKDMENNSLADVEEEKSMDEQPTFGYRMHVSTPIMGHTPKMSPMPNMGQTPIMPVGHAKIQSPNMGQTPIMPPGQTKASSPNMGQTPIMPQGQVKAPSPSIGQTPITAGGQIKAPSPSIGQTPVMVGGNIKAPSPSMGQTPTSETGKIKAASPSMGQAPIMPAGQMKAQASSMGQSASGSSGAPTPPSSTQSSHPTPKPTKSRKGKDHRKKAGKMATAQQSEVSESSQLALLTDKSELAEMTALVEKAHLSELAQIFEKAELSETPHPAEEAEVAMTPIEKIKSEPSKDSRGRGSETSSMVAIPPQAKEPAMSQMSKDSEATVAEAIAKAHREAAQAARELKEKDEERSMIKTAGSGPAAMPVTQDSSAPQVLSGSLGKGTSKLASSLKSGPSSRLSQAVSRLSKTEAEARELNAAIQSQLSQAAQWLSKTDKMEFSPKQGSPRYSRTEQMDSGLPSTQESRNFPGTQFSTVSTRYSRGEQSDSSYPPSPISKTVQRFSKTDYLESSFPGMKSLTASPRYSRGEHIESLLPSAQHSQGERGSKRDFNIPTSQHSQMISRYTRLEPSDEKVMQRPLVDRPKTDASSTVQPLGGKSEQKTEEGSPAQAGMSVQQESINTKRAAPQEPQNTKAEGSQLGTGAEAKLEMQPLKPSEEAGDSGDRSMGEPQVDPKKLGGGSNTVLDKKDSLSHLAEMGGGADCVVMTAIKQDQSQTESGEPSKTASRLMNVASRLSEVGILGSSVMTGLKQAANRLSNAGIGLSTMGKPGAVHQVVSQQGDGGGKSKTGSGFASQLVVGDSSRLPSKSHENYPSGVPSTISAHAPDLSKMDWSGFGFIDKEKEFSSPDKSNTELKESGEKINPDKPRDAEASGSGSNSAPCPVTPSKCENTSGGMPNSATRAPEAPQRNVQLCTFCKKLIDGQNGRWSCDCICRECELPINASLGRRCCCYKIDNDTSLKIQLMNWKEVPEVRDPAWVRASKRVQVTEQLYNGDTRYKSYDFYDEDQVKKRLMARKRAQDLEWKKMAPFIPSQFSMPSPANNRIVGTWERSPIAPYRYSSGYNRQEDQGGKSSGNDLPSSRQDSQAIDWQAQKEGQRDYPLPSMNEKSDSVSWDEKSEGKPPSVTQQFNVHEVQYGDLVKEALSVSGDIEKLLGRKKKKGHKGEKKKSKPTAQDLQSGDVLMGEGHHNLQLISRKLKEGIAALDQSKLIDQEHLLVPKQRCSDAALEGRAKSRSQSKAVGRRKRSRTAEKEGRRKAGRSGGFPADVRALSVSVSNPLLKSSLSLSDHNKQGPQGRKHTNGHHSNSESQRGHGSSSHGNQQHSNEHSSHHHPGGHHHGNDSHVTGSHRYHGEHRRGDSSSPHPGHSRHDDHHSSHSRHGHDRHDNHHSSQGRQGHDRHDDHSPHQQHSRHGHYAAHHRHDDHSPHSRHDSHPRRDSHSPTHSRHDMPHSHGRHGHHDNQHTKHSSQLHDDHHGPGSRHQVGHTRSSQPAGHVSNFAMQNQLSSHHRKSLHFHDEHTDGTDLDQARHHYHHRSTSGGRPSFMQPTSSSLAREVHPNTPYDYLRKLRELHSSLRSTRSIHLDRLRSRPRHGSRSNHDDDSLDDDIMEAVPIEWLRSMDDDEEDAYPAETMLIEHATEEPAEREEEPWRVQEVTEPVKENTAVVKEVVEPVKQTRRTAQEKAVQVKEATQEGKEDADMVAWYKELLECIHKFVAPLIEKYQLKVDPRDVSSQLLHDMIDTAFNDPGQRQVAIAMEKCRSSGCLDAGTLEVLLQRLEEMEKENEQIRCRWATVQYDDLLDCTACDFAPCSPEPIVVCIERVPASDPQCVPLENGQCRPTDCEPVRFTNCGRAIQRGRRGHDPVQELVDRRFHTRCGAEDGSIQFTRTLPQYVVNTATAQYDLEAPSKRIDSMLQDKSETEFEDAMNDLLEMKDRPHLQAGIPAASLRQRYKSRALSADGRPQQAAAEAADEVTGAARWASPRLPSYEESLTLQNRKLEGLLQSAGLPAKRNHSSVTEESLTDLETDAASSLGSPGSRGDRNSNCNQSAGPRVYTKLGTLQPKKQPIHVSTPSMTVSHLETYRNDYSRHLERSGVHSHLGLLPVNIMEELSEDMLETCIDKVVQEILTINSDIVEHTYQSEFKEASIANSSEALSEA